MPGGVWGLAALLAPVAAAMRGEGGTAEFLVRRLGCSQYCGIRPHPIPERWPTFRHHSPCGGGANSFAALCGFLSPGKLRSLSAKDFAWHLGVHRAPCPFRQYVPIHSRPNLIRRNTMSSYKNNVRLEGNLGNNAEKKTTPNGDVVNFSIAVNEEWKDKDGNEHKNTDWFQIQVWGPLVKIAAHLKAGTPVIVEGKIKPETYTVDGVEHKTFSIKADYIRKIDYSAPNEASESKAAKPAKKAK
jgi:single-strand DNA-binding protein